jgi:hypothetical protein
LEGVGRARGMRDEPLMTICTQAQIFSVLRQTPDPFAPVPRDYRAWVAASSSGRTRRIFQEALAISQYSAKV